MEDQIYIYHAEMCKMLSHPKRLEIINLLRDGEVNVTELNLKLHMSPANLSQHLALMRERKILNTRKEGNVVYYRLANIRFLEAYDILRGILVEQIQKDARMVETMPLQIK
ncbi:MAG: metalloregulator ArsR/SmtB family transcription factor [Dehalococcoidia bacterium]|nr:metalloregulator ArsR/SmtB family transcription factor [Dehalococcoidia bacterium]